MHNSLELWALTRHLGTYDNLAEFCPGDITLNELRLITYIAIGEYKGNPVGVGEIAAWAKIPRSTVSRMVQKWIEEEFITSRPHPTDARRTQFFLEPMQRQHTLEKWAKGALALSRANPPPEGS